MAVDAVLRVSDLDAPEAADLADVRVVSKLGGTLDDSRLVEGLVLDLPAAKGAGGPSRVENARVALIQYQLSPPKSDMENNVVVGDYAAMDRILKEERAHILAAVKRVRAAGCNVLLVQKSILRDAVSDMALHYLAKAKIMVVRDVERDDVEFISKTLGLAPVAHPDALLPERLAHVGLVEEIEAGRSRVVQLTGIQSRGRTATILLRASNSMVLEEAHRSLHDALCAVRCLVARPALLPGGGAPEVELALRLRAWARGLQGVDMVAVRAFADALEVIPFTLAENAGLEAIRVVAALRAAHARGEASAGIDVRKGGISDMNAENVVQPLRVTDSALALATECVRLILKIDDVVPVR
ncbi:TCP-1/cpn60 chaperonin [Helicosporidium sp. ATCC 50920]|nr:TCP-1/cpn60 chaperonin [Helicosporidium sp. ATCC 50920]|eukprot:KDD72270.1 TCP-1/cpn60 chaperonin [Helicosporidium sp. ATCC 50920]